MKHRLHPGPRHLALALLLAAPMGLASAGPAWAQSKRLKPQAAQIALGNLPLRAMWALESNDLKTLAKLSHSKGIRFSPGIFAAPTDRTFTPAQIRTLDKRGPIKWGSQDGSGDVITIDWNGFRRQLWERDFSVGKLTFNTFTRRGNTRNNLRQAYSDAIFVESYVPYSPKYGGMDWGSLWMIWKREGGRWKLRGLARDYWTT